jgi:CheY-like chemotaxis protein
VQDRGIGICREQLDRVFDRFWRADDSASAGAGLGLAVARGIVETHGGRIGVTSQLGVGSTFSFTLPLQPGESDRVLLVDDDRDVAQSMARLIRSLGHDTRVAFSGHEALDVAAQFQPHIILMDLALPGLSGYDTARAIRSTQWGKDVTLVAVSGWGRASDRRHALDAGFDQHLTKPVDVHVLEAVLTTSGAPTGADPATH